MVQSTTSLRRTLIHNGLFVEDELAGRGSDADVRGWLLEDRLLPEILLRQLEADAFPLRLGRYRITGRLGRGGMGLVLRAMEEGSRREVALKLLPADAPEHHERRFTQEGQLLERLAHPNVLQVHARCRVQDAHFLALELVEGGSLEDRLGQGPLSERECWVLIRQLAGALQRTAEAGVVHRDLKPANILCADDGEGGVTYKLCDFGIARLRERPLEDLSISSSQIVVGSPAYMSPEQVRLRELDHRSDMYSLGLTLHEALTGELPLWEPGQAAIVLLARHAKEEVPDVREKAPHVSAPLARLLAQLCALDPAERPASWEQVLGWASSPAAHKAAHEAPPPPEPPPALGPFAGRAARAPTRAEVSYREQRAAGLVAVGCGLGAAVGMGVAGITPDAPPIAFGLAGGASRWIEQRLGWRDATAIHGAVLGVCVWALTLALVAVCGSTVLAILLAAGLATGSGGSNYSLNQRLVRYSGAVFASYFALGIFSEHVRDEGMSLVSLGMMLPLWVALIGSLTRLLDAGVDQLLPEHKAEEELPIAGGLRPLLDVRRWQAIDWAQNLEPGVDLRVAGQPGDDVPLDLLESDEASGGEIVISEGQVKRPPRPGAQLKRRD